MPPAGAPGTGGGAGIGAGGAHALANHRHHVAVLDRVEDAPVRSPSGFTPSGGTTVAARAEVSDPELTAGQVLHLGGGAHG
ncbi:hypothetical protein [Actinoalloteichus spitiensis]|uniref:hypothetical protein n=1 Tax=Actinoalloteichus spitiensis TaxID=252394 RepID=UPI0012F6D37C|nr:hypothetical protein [Actinoalloteichus spitiensis]